MSFRFDLKIIENYGLLGLFIGCVTSNATLFLPTVSLSLVVGATSFFSNLLCGLIGGAGAAIGELISYILGRSSRETISRYQMPKWLVWIEKLSDEKQSITIFIFSLVPLPLFDIIGVISGVNKMKVFKFFIPCLMGKIIKMVVFAYIGNISINLVQSFF